MFEIIIGGMIFGAGFICRGALQKKENSIDFTKYDACSHEKPSSGWTGCTYKSNGSCCYGRPIGYCSEDAEQESCEWINKD